MTCNSAVFETKVTNQCAVVLATEDFTHEANWQIPSKFDNTTGYGAGFHDIIENLNSLVLRLALTLTIPILCPLGVILLS